MQGYLWLPNPIIFIVLNNLSILPGMVATCCKPSSGAGVSLGQNKPKSWSGSHLTIKWWPGLTSFGLWMIVPSSCYTRVPRKTENAVRIVVCNCGAHGLQFKPLCRQSFSPLLWILAVTVSILYVLSPSWENNLHWIFTSEIYPNCEKGLVKSREWTWVLPFHEWPL